MKPRALLVLLALAVVLLIGPRASSQEARPRWWKGNTHAHTTRCGHADSSPEAVAAWYLDHGYHFLVLSEHNQFIDPATVALPEGRREDFVLVPGEELTGARVVHTTSFDTTGVVDWRSHEGASVADVITTHVANVAAKGGLAILNHPNYHWAVSLEDLRAARTLGLLELWNGHPKVGNAGDAEHPSVEALWDGLLTGGRVVWAVASDDVHHLAKWGREHSNPGRGWIVVESDELTPAALHAALAAGRFHASNGVALARVARGPRALEVAVDVEATARELDSPLVVGRAGRGRAGLWTLEAIGRDGAVLETVAATHHRFEVPDGEPYLRVRATFARPVGDVAPDALGEVPVERFFAWTQPVFTDGRDQPPAPR